MIHVHEKPYPKEVGIIREHLVSLYHSDQISDSTFNLMRVLICHEYGHCSMGRWDYVNNDGSRVIINYCRYCEDLLSKDMDKVLDCEVCK